MRKAAAILGSLHLVLWSCISCSRTVVEVDAPASVLRVGVLPDQDRVVLERRYAPLLAYLSAVTGLETELVIPSTYAELGQIFARGGLELARFGGASFCRANDRSAARPLVMRDVDLAFTTVFITSSRGSRTSLAEFRGRSFAFGPTLSTSGHLMPRHFLAGLAIEPSAFFSEVRHSQGHDQTVRWVESGLVELGAVNSIVVEMMLLDGRLDKQAIRIVATTPPYQDYVWAVPPSMSEELRVDLLDAFLALDISKDQHQKVLSALGASFFLPADWRDYDEIAEALDQHGTHLERDDD